VVQGAWPGSTLSRGLAGSAWRWCFPALVGAVQEASPSAEAGGPGASCRSQTQWSLVGGQVCEQDCFVGAERGK